MCMWVSAAEAGERQRPFGDRRWGGENAREIIASKRWRGTPNGEERTCVCLSLSAAEGEGSLRERVALWRERPFGIVVGKLETLAFFFKNGTF